MRHAYARISFIAKYPVPASPIRGLALGAELVDSIALLHSITEVEVEPRWWRRICGFTSLARCGRGAGGPGLRVAVYVDSEPDPAAAHGADLVYQLDTRHGSVLRLEARGSSSRLAG